jgi:hypothetical protein
LLSVLPPAAIMRSAYTCTWVFISYQQLLWIETPTSRLQACPLSASAKLGLSCLIVRTRSPNTMSQLALEVPNPIHV